jgi:hypothetical protein
MIIPFLFFSFCDDGNWQILVRELGNILHLFHGSSDLSSSLLFGFSPQVS